MGSIWFHSGVTGVFFLHAGPVFPSRVNTRKYSSTSEIASKLVPNLKTSQSALISAAYANPTRKKHDAL